MRCRSMRKSLICNGNAFMTLLAFLNDLMPLMRQHILNSQTHLTHFFGLAAYFIFKLR